MESAPVIVPACERERSRPSPRATLAAADRDAASSHQDALLPPRNWLTMKSPPAS